VGLLSGKVVVVAGVGPGLGRQIAVVSAAAGASVVLGARSEPFIAELEEQIAAAGGAAASCRCDVTVDADCRRLVQTAVERFGGLDCMISNAFVADPMHVPIAESDFEQWMPAFNVNLFGSLRMAQAAIPALRERGRGSIVFVGSQIIRRVRVGRGPYASSKAALLAAAQVLAREVGEHGIRVNTVVPGQMLGPNYTRYYGARAAEHGVTLEEELAPVLELLALRAIPTDAEVAGAVVFLASDLSIAMTGQTIDVNGGETFT
jgi:NAD(P)-dependent dehydrogenase (short-subunit alcohol dehydrogenase family)